MLLDHTLKIQNFNSSGRIHSDVNIDNCVIVN